MNDEGNPKNAGVTWARAGTEARPYGVSKDTRPYRVSKETRPYRAPEEGLPYNVLSVLNGNAGSRELSCSILPWCFYKKNGKLLL